MIDVTETAALFAIVEAAQNHGQQFIHIRDAALAYLKKINEEQKDGLAPPQGSSAAPAEDEPPKGETTARFPDEHDVDNQAEVDPPHVEAPVVVDEPTYDPEPRVERRV